MTTHNATAVTDAVIAYQKPITLQQGRALRDNPIATTEGSAGAPYEYTAWRPYNSTVWGDGFTGLLFDRGADPATALVTTPTLVTGWDYKILFRNILPTNNTSEFLSLEVNTGSWSSKLAITPATANAVADGRTHDGWIDLYNPALASGTRKLGEFSGGVAGVSNNSIATASTTGVVIVKQTSGAAITAARIGFSAVNIDAGQVYLLKRRPSGGVY